MKRIPFFWSLGLSVLLIWTTQDGMSQSTSPNAPGRESRPVNANAGLVEPMTTLAAQLKSLRKTGNPDVDYAALTRLHHQTELDLLQLGIRNGKNAELVNFLKTVVPQKEKDLAELNQITNETSAGSSNASFSQEINQKLNAMDMDVQKGLNGRMTGDRDKDLVAILMQHHQDGIDLSQTYLKYGVNPTLRTHAERMVAAAKRELETMKQLIK